MKNIKTIIKEMTIEEKVALASGKDFWKTVDLPRLKIPSMFLADGPHGVRKMADSTDHLGKNQSIPATCFPPAVTMSQSWNPDFCQAMGHALGLEAKTQHVHVLLGPGMNIKRNPLCGRNFEYFSEDPYLSGKIAASYVRGIQANGISACIKHFALNNQEYRRMSIDSIVDERTMREIYLTAFEIAVKEGVPKTLMTSYNQVNGTYTNEHTHLIKDILRQEWGYAGMIVSDWGGNNDRVQALLAGSNLEMPSTCGDTNRNLSEAITEGDVSETILDASIEPIIRLALETDENMKDVSTSFSVDEHHRLAQKAHEESIVLLKNNQILPLGSDVKVSIIGDFAHRPRYQGDGSSIVNPTRLDTIISSIEDYPLNYQGYAQGFLRLDRPSKKLRDEAVRLAQQSDVSILFLGLDESSEIEGSDRAHMKIPNNQITLLKAVHQVCSKIVVVLSCGSAVETDWDEMCDALVYAALGGQAGARAILNVLCGQVNPSGKLTETFPIKYEDIAASHYFPGREMTVEYREGPFVGYRYFDTNNIPVKYPFGYGMSYTEFAYQHLKIDEGGVIFIIKNIGHVAGAEIAQLYVMANQSHVYRPKKELKGFLKIFLHPGESQTVRIPFDAYTFRYYNTYTNSWEEESLTYTIIIGASVDDVRLEGAYAHRSTSHKILDQREDLPSYFSGNVDHISESEFEALIQRPRPISTRPFYRRNRLRVDMNTTIHELRYAPGWTGRFFSRAIDVAIFWLKLRKKRYQANFLENGILNLPLRGMSRMSGGVISQKELDGLIIAFNGACFKGFKIFFHSRRLKRRKENREHTSQSHDLES